MKYKLNAKDRLAIPRILPKTGSMLEQTTVEEILDLVRLTSIDWPRFGLSETEECSHCGQSGGLISQDSLDPEKNPKLFDDAEFSLTKAQTELMKKAVSDLDKEGKVDQFVLQTCRKINDMRGAIEEIPEEQKEAKK